MPECGLEARAPRIPGGISAKEEERVTIAVPGTAIGPAAVSGAVSGDPGSGVAVVLAHGAGNDMDSDFMRTFHAGLAERGFLVLRFNFLYKEGNRKLPDPRPLLEVCFRAAADFARERARGKLVLGGKSMGGRIASHLVASGYAADGLLFLGYPLHPPGKPDQMRDRHLYDIRCPMLFLSGTRDAFAGRDRLAGVVERIGPRATLTWLEGADHSYRVKGRSAREVYAEALEATVRWLSELP